jgi:hypothetical protein
MISNHGGDKIISFGSTHHLQLSLNTHSGQFTVLAVSHIGNANCNCKEKSSLDHIHNHTEGLMIWQKSKAHLIASRDTFYSAVSLASQPLHQRWMYCITVTQYIQRCKSEGLACETRCIPVACCKQSCDKDCTQVQ